MDAVGANVEAPFEDGYSDTPMTALCRTIEINLRQMVGEKELPPALQPRYLEVGTLAGSKSRHEVRGRLGFAKFIGLK